MAAFPELAEVDDARGVPRTALIATAAVTLVVSVWAARRPDGLGVLVSIVDVGALAAFLLLQVSVVGYFVRKRRAAVTPLHAIVPVCGAAVILWVLVEASAFAQQVAAVWLVACVAVGGANGRGRHDQGQPGFPRPERGSSRACHGGGAGIACSGRPAPHAGVGTTGASLFDVTVRSTRVRLLHVATVVVSCAVYLVVPSHAAAPQVTTATDAATVMAAARALGASASEAEVVDAYGPGPLATSWTTTHGTLSDAADAALARVRGADAHGLRPADYLTPVIAAAIAAPAHSAEDRLRRDVAITVAGPRYMRHLHLGRADLARARTPPRDSGAARLRCETGRGGERWTGGRGAR